MEAEPQRYRLELEFDGTSYVGWQRQNNGPSIQAELERAVHAMLGETTTAIAAGRTDAGVHALALTVHIDLRREIDPYRLAAGLNHHLRSSKIAVLRAQTVDQDFHARFSAQARRYTYKILNRQAPPTLAQNRSWHVKTPLDLGAMQQAAQSLIGYHDFTSFRAAECQAKSPVKTLTSLTIEDLGDEIHLHIQAPSFLHHQVRNITGTLKLIGTGARPVEFAKQALEARDRKAAGPTAPAMGLYFVEAIY